MTQNRKPRATHAVDGDVEMEQVVARYKELRVWKERADEELKQLREKLAVRMAEHDADALTVKGGHVARYTEFDRESLDTKGLKETHPRIYQRFLKFTHVERVDVP